MKSSKKIFVLLITLVMLVSCLTACGKKEDNSASSEQKIALGTSAFSISVNVPYKEGTVTDEDKAEDQVAYWFSHESDVDFDVYQWKKEEGETLESAAAEDAAPYKAEVKETSFNDIKLCYYMSQDEDEGVKYDTINYLTDDGENIVEIVFWLDGDNPKDEVQSIISTIEKK